MFCRTSYYLSTSDSFTVVCELIGTKSGKAQN